MISAGQKYNVPPAVMAAVMSKESGGGYYLKTIKALNSLANKRPELLTRARQQKYAKSMTPQRVLDFLKETIKNKIPTAYEQYKNYTLDDIPNLKNDKENVWGDWGFGYGIVQFDIQHHPIKVINFLNAKTPQIRNQMLIEHQAKLLEKEIAVAKSMHPKWTDAQILRAAVAAYNTGQDHKKMTTFNRAKLDSTTASKDYSSDALARALYFADLGLFYGKATTKKIKASVGKRGINNNVDTTVVQQLLLDRGGNLGKWGADGDAGSITIQAIKDFQEKQMGQKKPSGLIEPNDATWNALYTGLESIEITEIEGFSSVELPLRLSAGVGKGQNNKLADVKLVQALLKAWGQETPVNGDSKSSNLLKHIKDFQGKHFKGKWSPDGVISVNGDTIKKLMEKYKEAKSFLNPPKKDDNQPKRAGNAETKTNTNVKKTNAAVSPMLDDEPAKHIKIRPLLSAVGVRKTNKSEDV